jgi:hypothetical protein
MVLSRKYAKEKEKEANNSKKIADFKFLFPEVPGPDSVTAGG